MKISEYTDDIIALVVTGVATGCAAYLTYTTGEIPEFFAVGFGVIIAYHFSKKPESVEEATEEATT